MKFYTLLFISTCFYCKAQNLEQKLRDSLIANMNNEYYAIHITPCEMDRNLFIVGLEWGAARQKLWVLKYNDFGNVLWKTPISEDSIPGYINHVGLRSLTGFANPFIEIVAGERGIYAYFLFELNGGKIKNRIPLKPMVIYEYDYGTAPQPRQLNLSERTYKDLNKDGFDDIVITGTFKNGNKKTPARKVLMYNPHTNHFEEDIKQRISIIQAFGD